MNFLGFCYNESLFWAQLEFGCFDESVELDLA